MISLLESLKLALEK